MSSMLNREVPMEIIDSLLGRGLGYDEWEAELKILGYGDLWNEALKNKIIKREYETFKSEILHLKHESNTATKGKDVQKTNSSESILKRLQGQEWAKGRPSEKEERLKSRRLLGKDAKKRAFQNYVRDWEQAESSAALSSKFCGEAGTHGSQEVGRSAMNGETSFSAHQSMDSQLSQTFASPSKQQMFGGVEPTMQGADWHVQSSDPSTVYSGSCNSALHISTNNQLGYPNHSPQNDTTQSCNISASTFNQTSPANSVGGYRMSTPWVTTPIANTTMLMATNNTSWAENIYPTGSTEENDTAAQLDWLAYVDNSCIDVMHN